MLDGLVHLLFPEVCILCQKPLGEGEEHICAGCFNDFNPFPSVLAGGAALKSTVRAHFGEKAVPAAAWCLYPYRSRGSLHEAMHAMKYGGLFPLGELFGKRLGELICQGGVPVGFDAIVPVPLHHLKRIERTYNQAEALARGMAGLIGLPVATRSLERCVYTGTQTGLGLEARRENMAGAFRPGRERCPARVLLVDDVLTTGATMVSAAKVLKAAGAVEVAFATVALTEKE
ncbi:ComF family protein [Chlorobaculum tepidum]|uniref:ComF family protein n=1 Tax=Chlorobaculum tepidum TaxID=1097 RepID=UPI0002FEC861|nr:ComF family protein [Chlorobaculum tepidum]